MAKKIGVVVYTVNPRLVARFHIFTENRYARQTDSIPSADGE